MTFTNMIIIDETITVSANSRDLIPSDLPISVRLEGVLAALGVRKLGDLTGKSYRDIVLMKNCGRKTITELRLLLERASAGEFVASPKELAKMGWADLPAQLDELVQELPKRVRQIAEARLGPPSKQAPTLEVVGTKFKLTRERVRQVMVLVSEDLLRAGGIRLKTQAQRIAAFCEESVCPLTPELLQRWVGGKKWNFQHDPAFYVRLMGLIYSNLPVWPEGQESYYKPAKRADRLARVVEAQLQTGPRSIPLRTALEKVRAQLGVKKVKVGDFLLELKHSWNLVTVFPKADKPEVSLRRRAV